MGFAMTLANPQMPSCTSGRKATARRVSKAMRAVYDVGVKAVK
jgi:hypothetical protein